MIVLRTTADCGFPPSRAGRRRTVGSTLTRVLCCLEGAAEFCAVVHDELEESSYRCELVPGRESVEGVQTGALDACDACDAALLARSSFRAAGSRPRLLAALNSCLSASSGV